MSIPISLLCPIDFSPSSLGALHYALAIARRFHARLTVLTVADALVSEVGDVRNGVDWLRDTTELALRRFVEAAQDGFTPVDVAYEVRTGKAAPIVREVARAIGCHLIVMSTHGRSGVRKWMFGATAERVLRETVIPVLLVPADPGALSYEALAHRASPMLVPVDFSAATAQQIKVAGWIADELRCRVMIGHVIEPIDLPVPEQIDASEVMSERHRRACQGLQAIAVGASIHAAPEILIAEGRPPVEIARWASEHHAGLIVMALHSDPDGGPRMGSVTYDAIARSAVLMLALPPARPS